MTGRYEASPLPAGENKEVEGRDIMLSLNHHYKDNLAHYEQKGNRQLFGGYCLDLLTNFAQWSVTKSIPQDCSIILDSWIVNQEQEPPVASTKRAIKRETSSRVKEVEGTKVEPVVSAVPLHHFSSTFGFLLIQYRTQPFFLPNNLYSSFGLRRILA